jgi:hypothetical protein
MTTRAQRLPVNFPVVLRQGPDLLNAMICNISASGPCLIGLDRLRKGDTMVLDYAIGQTRATVTWTVGKMAGVKFDDILSEIGVQCVRAARQMAS